ALTIEPLTPLGRWTSRGEAIPAPDDRAADEFLLAHDRLEQSGYDHYEVSNAARPGFRARHNSAYWLRAAFIGLGPSAHSGSGDRRSWNTREWEDYRRRVESGASPREDEERLDRRAMHLEDLYLALRTDRGVSTGSVPLHLRQSWLREEWATEYDGRVRLTPEGWLRLDALVAALPDS
ncbi:MAG: radical SAM family heme chaperone HemW, partial [Gemmatimonadales bacterium]